MSSSQSGIAQNVVSMGVLIEKVTAFSTKYNPSRVEFTIVKLKEVKASAEAAIKAEGTASNAKKKSAAIRNLILKALVKLITRSLNSLQISGAMEKTIEQGEAIVRELRGQRAEEKYSDEEIAAAKASGEELKYNAMHYGTIDSKMDNIGKYIQLIETEPLYNPNEPELATAAINDQYTALKTAQADWNRTDVNLDTVRVKRDLVISGDITGLCDIGAGVKKYVKSAFGPDSPEFKSLGDVKFRKNK